MDNNHADSKATDEGVSATRRLQGHYNLPTTTTTTTAGLLQVTSPLDVTVYLHRAFGWSAD